MSFYFLSNLPSLTTKSLDDCQWTQAPVFLMYLLLPFPEEAVDHEFIGVTYCRVSEELEEQW